jgi:hypothetical protein
MRKPLPGAEKSRGLSNVGSLALALIVLLPTPALMNELSSSQGPGGRAPVAEKGVLGQWSPPAADVRLPDTVVHQDTTGGTNQSLRALCGSDGGGFAAVWQDPRDGMLGLYLLRLDASGEPLEPERPIHEPHAGRRLDPAVALAPDGSGAVAWTAPRPDTPPVAFLRFFDSKGRFLAPDKALGATEPRVEPGTRARPTGATKVTVIRRRDGNYAIAWSEEGRVKLLEADASGTWRDRPGVVNVETSKAQPGVRLAVEKGGGLLCAWKVGDRYFATALGQAPDPSRKAAEGSARSCGEGILETLESASEGGFWALVKLEGIFELRHLSPAGEPDRPAIRPFDETVSVADIARWHGGLALLAGRASGTLEVSLFGDDGKRIEDAPTTVTSPESRGAEEARIAANGATLMVAWTDHRNGDTDVYGRTLDPKSPPEKRLGPERRLNSDTASAGQINPAVAASGSRAVIAWQDERDQQPHIYARLVTWPGGFAGDEFQVPMASAGSSAPASSAIRGLPAVSVLENGDFVVLWAEGPPKRIALRGQLFHADAHPSGEPFLVREVGRAPTHIVSVALTGDRGYLLAWDDLIERSIWVTRLAPDGIVAEPKKIAGGGKGAVQEPALALLDGDRWIAGWSSSPDGDVWTVRARFLDLDGTPEGEEFGFERTMRGQDWDPSLAHAGGGGFMMSWCSGARSDPGKDVVARLFDAHGRPAGPLLPISPLSNEQDHGHVIRLVDGSWAVTWEDDISIHDETYLRRIEKNGRELGPIVLINGLETLSMPDRQGPVVAPLADGVAALWGDRRRSKGWDVFIKLVGPRFDDVRRR